MTDIQKVISKFSGKDIRVFEENGDLWIPVMDIADAIGYEWLQPPISEERETTYICYLFFDINVVVMILLRGIDDRYT